MPVMCRFRACRLPFLSYRPGVTRGQKAHCRMATAAGRTDEGLAGNSECVHGGVIIGQCLIFNVLLNVLNLFDSALPF